MLKFNYVLSILDGNILIWLHFQSHTAYITLIVIHLKFATGALYEVDICLIDCSKHYH